MNQSHKMKKKVLVISLNFRVAHISHLIANYKQMQELGYDVTCLVHPEALAYMPKNIKCITDTKGLGEFDYSIFWFPSMKNISKMVSLRLIHKSKIIYVYHEPIESFKEYVEAGNSKLDTIKILMKYSFALSFLKLSDMIILPSQKAIQLYEKGIAKKFNSNYEYLPLLYCDETTEETKKQKRKYISYIGGICNDHGFDEYVDFIMTAYKEKEFHNIKFLIATRNTFKMNEILTLMQKERVLEVVQGKPMSNDEINSYYASSFLVWNAYNRTTQSGVLAKAFMFGTPAIVLRNNLSEFVEDGREVVAIDDNRDYKQLAAASHVLIDDNMRFSQNARENFERNYLYSSHNEEMAVIIAKL